MRPGKTNRPLTKVLQPKFNFIIIINLFIYNLYTGINSLTHIENKFVGETLFYKIDINIERSKQ